MSWELAGNQLGDKIPFSFGKFKQLEYLDQTQLVFLDLSYNSFQGHLPFSLGKLEQLSHLLLSTNNFTCQILNEFSNLTQLIELELYVTTWMVMLYPY
jgi:hypothetical protein